MNNAIEIEARLIALEYLVKHLLWNLVVLRADQDGENDLQALNEMISFSQDTAEDLGTSVFSRPGLDPAGSDHLAVSVRDHVERVVQELAGEMAKELNLSRSSQGSRA